MKNEKFSKNKFTRKDEWFLRGKNFSVSIVHTLRTDFSVLSMHTLEEGISTTEITPVHAWCLYATINSEHVLFNSACKNKNAYDLELGDRLYPYFHGGCTYYCRQASYVKIGCDYQHLGDEEFMTSAEIPDKIWEDAETLFKHMSVVRVHE